MRPPAPKKAPLAPDLPHGLAWLPALIFVTGGAILALELLASRILTPYFGVSLYIWAGILSITLVALAIGYWLGGRLARRAQQHGRGPVPELLRLYLLMPMVAALCLGLAALVYPWLFPDLARFDLVLGSLLACLVLLFVPLVATSSMNPLLVALQTAREKRAGAVADAGAGRVFFISTLGSVVGVPVTAFALIPHVSNYAATLGIGVLLAGLAVAATLWLGPLAGGRGRLLALGIFGALLCGVLLGFSRSYLRTGDPIAAEGLISRIEAEYRSVFGNIKIIRTESPEFPGEYIRMYFQDGIIQNRTDETGRSLSLFTWALEALALGADPDARSALVLGLGAGILPMRLGDRGIAVEVVEINPGSWRAAQEFFGFDPTRFVGHTVDARTFVEDCTARHDIVLVDLFQGDGVPEHLMTREFFAGVRRCLKPDGVAAFNAFAEDPEANRHLLATLKAAFPSVMMTRPPEALGSTQSFLLASNGLLRADLAVPVPQGVPAFLSPQLELHLASLEPVTEAMVRGGEVVTDWANFLPWAYVEAFLNYRRNVVENFPPQILVN